MEFDLEGALVSPKTSYAQRSCFVAQ